MSKKKDRRLFVKLYTDITQTELWYELKAYDIFVYTELLSKRSYGKGEKPDTFILTPIMMKNRVSAPRFYKSISNLLRRGLIEIHEFGGIGIEGQRRANVYILSTKWQGVLEKRKEAGKERFLLPREHSPQYRPIKQKKRKTAA